MADVDTDKDFAPDTEAIADGYFHESEYRCAPYFNVRIDGIELIVKPSAMPESEIAKKQKQLADKAEMTFQLARPVPLPQSYAFRVSPFVKK
jgi:hypothetical protein